MNILMIIMGGVLVLVCIGVWVGVYYIVRIPALKVDRSLGELVELIKEEKDTAFKEKMDKEMIKYSRDRYMGEIPRGVLVVGNRDEEPIRVGKELIPFNLSTGEKEILRMFYGRDL